MKLISHLHLHPAPPPPPPPTSKKGMFISGRKNSTGISSKAYAFSHMMHKLGLKGTHSLYIFMKSEERKENDKFKVKKVTKLNLKIISKPHAFLQTREKKMCKVSKKTGLKLYEKLQTRGTHSLYI